MVGEVVVCISYLCVEEIYGCCGCCGCWNGRFEIELNSCPRVVLDAAGINVADDRTIFLGMDEVVN